MATTAITTPSGFRLDSYPIDTAFGLANDVRRGLLASPKALLPKYFYDGAGSDLFEQITGLPEYYQTRTELRILTDTMPGIVARHRPGELVELGSGSSTKTVAILDAMRSAGTLRRYVPFDVSEGALVTAAERTAERYPGVTVHAIAGDFDEHLGHIPPPASGVRRLIAFLGGTIGNLLPAQRRVFLRTMRSLLGPEDRLLVGIDLVKDVARLEAAYNDALGVTAEFNLNVLRVINRELDADFDLTRFAHVAFYDTENAWIEMRVRSRVDQTVHVGTLGLIVPFAAGEEMRTEVSCKFTHERLATACARAGLAIHEFHTDPDALFAVAIIGRGEAV
jgi:L-histidine N-alpha-methyltransferase